jgi:predicted HTH transcriptional regulator
MKLAIMQPYFLPYIGYWQYPTMYSDFEENSGGFLAKIGYKEQKIFKKKENVTDNDTDSRFEKILQLIKHNQKITTKKLSEKLNVSQITIKRDLVKLKKQHKLIRLGSEKAGYWEVLS